MDVTQPITNLVHFKGEGNSLIFGDFSVALWQRLRFVLKF